MHLVDSVELNERREVGLVVEAQRISWWDPRVIVAIAGTFVAAVAAFLSFVTVCVVVGGALLGAYVLNETKTVSSEMTNAQVAVEIGKVNANVDRLGNDMQTVIKAITATQTTQNVQEKDIEEIKDRLVTLERDYTSNLTTRLARVEARTGIKSAGGD